MTQSDFGTINPTTKSGTQLAEDLNDFRDALNTKHSGAARPSYVQAGMEWLDTSAAPIWTVKLYDGSNDIVLYQIDTTNNIAKPTQTRQEVIKTADYTLAPDDAYVAIIMNKASAAVVALPALSGTNSELYFVKNIAANAVTIDPNSTETIEGASTLTLATDESAWIWPASGKGSWRVVKTARIFDASLGSASEPSHTFTADNDTGMYRSGANQIGFTTGGTLRVTVDVNSVTFVPPLLAGTGSAGAPSFAFALDPDTGMYRSGANVLNFTTGGTDILSLASNVVQVVSGTIQAGTPSASGASQGIGFSDALLTSSKNSTSSLTHFRFCNPNGQVGTIVTAGTGTAYNTTSDGRLKINREKLSDEIDVGAIIDAVEPFAYDWLSGISGEPTGDRDHGFIAQELYEIIPSAVFVGNGEVGDEDFTPWAIDNSKLVPYLWAGLKIALKENMEMKKRIEALEEKVK